MSQIIRIAVPTSGAGGIDAPRSAHFGHAESFTIIDVAEGQLAGSTVLTNPPHSHGGCGQTVRLLADNDVSVAIVVGMGRGPLSMMQPAGIVALFDDVSPTPRTAAEAYLAGGLTPFGDDRVCAGH